MLQKIKHLGIFTKQFVREMGKNIKLDGKLFIWEKGYFHMWYCKRERTMPIHFKTTI